MFTETEFDRIKIRDSKKKRKEKKERKKERKKKRKKERKKQQQCWTFTFMTCGGS